MPILDIQKRARELGRIRLGQKGDRGQPQKLDRFRFTGHSRALLEKVAELYGGEAHEWTPAGGTQQWEVVSDTARVPIMVPPQPVSQWYEFWTRAGCQHRCDGRTNVLTDEPCDPEDPKHREALKKPTTRLNVVLRDVEGIGVWRVETHGWNAAIELPDVAEFLAQAGGYVNGWLALEQRTSVEQTDSGPKTRHYLVPIIEVDVTPAQLMAGHGRVVPSPALEGGPPAALGAGTAADEAAAEGPFGPYYEKVAAAKVLDDLAPVWDEARVAGLVGSTSEATPQRDAFVLAWKARAQELKAAEQPAAPAAGAEPDEDGVVDAELVEDPAVGEVDANVVWQQVLVAGGEQGMSLADVQDDFASKMGGLSAGEASPGELQHYLALLTGTGAAA